MTRLFTTHLEKLAQACDSYSSHQS